MRYVIYKIVQPECLQTRVFRDSSTKTIHRDVLEELEISGVQTKHVTFESAVDEIKSNSEKLINLKLTILPVMTITHDGMCY